MSAGPAILTLRQAQGEGDYWHVGSTRSLTLSLSKGEDGKARTILPIREGPRRGRQSPWSMILDRGAFTSTVTIARLLIVGVAALSMKHMLRRQ